MRVLGNVILFIGRFQPLHKGHVTVLRRLARKATLLKIGIGSSQYKHTDKNPFTARERAVMMRKALRAEGITRYRIYFIRDIQENEGWPGHVKKIVGAFDVVYSGNPLVLKLFSGKCYAVRRIKEMQPYSSTAIRRMMVCGKDISHAVPVAVLNEMKRIKAYGRVKSLYRY